MLMGIQQAIDHFSTGKAGHPWVSWWTILVGFVIGVIAVAIRARTTWASSPPSCSASVLPGRHHRSGARLVPGGLLGFIASVVVAIVLLPSTAASAKGMWHEKRCPARRALLPRPASRRADRPAAEPVSRPPTTWCGPASIAKPAADPADLAARSIRHRRGPCHPREKEG